MSGREDLRAVTLASTGSYQLTFAGSDAPFRTSRLVIIIRKRVERMVMADALPHLMLCLMNGSQNAMANQLPDLSATAPLIGYSVNISRVKPTSKKLPLAHAPTTSARCC